MWENFYAYKDSVQKAISMNKVDESLRRDYAEQIAIINNEVYNVSTSQNLMPNKINLQALAAIYARQPGNFASSRENQDLHSKGGQATSNVFFILLNFKGYFFVNNLG